MLPVETEAWPPIAVARLRELVGLHVTSEEAADKISELLGRRVTVQACRTKARRIGTPFSGANNGAQLLARRELVRSPSNEPGTHFRGQNGRNAGVTLQAAAHNQCRWPLGNPVDVDRFRYCGARVDCGSSYCPTHRQIARGGALQCSEAAQ